MTTTISMVSCTTQSRETLNEHDRFAIAITKDDNNVGHIPREISKVAWYFLQHGGEINCEISGRRKRSSVSGKGEVLCMYTFLGSLKMVNSDLRNS